MTSYKQEILESQANLFDKRSAAESHTEESLEVLWMSLHKSSQEILALLTSLCVQSPTKSIQMQLLFDKAKSTMIVRNRITLEQYLVEYRDHSIITFNQDVIKLIADENLLLRFLENKNVDLD